MKRYISLFFFLGLTTAVAAIARAFPPGDWYAGLLKPDWTPPDWLFGPVWSVLYLFIAIAGWLVWRGQGLGLALFFWLSQLVLNALWSYFMFGENRIDQAMIDVAFLWLAIAGFMVASWRVSRLAVVLFAPYLAWVSFAAALNLAILQLNGGW